MMQHENDEAMRLTALCDRIAALSNSKAPIPMVMVSDAIFDDVLATIRRRRVAFTGRKDGSNHRWVLKPGNFGFPSSSVDIHQTKYLIPRRANTEIVPLNRFSQEEEHLRTSGHQFQKWLYGPDGRTPIGKLYQSPAGVNVPLYFEDRSSSIFKAADTCAHPNCDVLATKLCSRCRGVRYCSVDHQRDDWADHKHLCTYLLGCEAPSGNG